jgi:hypothetical protein
VPTEFTSQRRDFGLYSLLFVCQKLACGANKNVQKQLRVRVTWQAISRTADNYREVDT